jgi:hypothetical protein
MVRLPFSRADADDYSFYFMAAASGADFPGEK